MCLSKNTKNAKFYFDGNSYVNSKKKIYILGIIINNAFLFDSYIKEVLKKATQKLTALSCSTNHLELEER